MATVDERLGALEAQGRKSRRRIAVLEKWRNQLIEQVRTGGDLNVAMRDYLRLHPGEIPDDEELDASGAIRSKIPGRVPRPKIPGRVPRPKVP